MAASKGTKKAGAKKTGGWKGARKAAAAKTPRKASTKKGASKKPAAKKPAAKKSAGKKAAAGKKASGKKAPAKKAPVKRPAARAGGEVRITIRMYRQGLGDCFLISIPREGEAPYRVVIDCGVILGTPDASRIIGEVVEDIIQTTGGRIDLLVATHEHWDHVSGFVQARELWTDASRLQIDKVWMGWTEDAGDDLGKKLRGERNALKIALAAASTRLRMSNDRRAADEVSNLLGFFGAAGDNTTSAALEVVRKLAGAPRYCHPQDAPFTVPGTEVKIYVLGPPHDEKFIKKYNPSKSQPETYGLAATEAFFRVVAPALDGDGETDAPFDEGVMIPLDAARQSPFFQRHYWGEADDGGEKEAAAARDQSWRRIDGSWLDASSPLALQLDSATNNTSLVLAFELPSGEVFLFAADAQVGNWMSWQDLSWTVDGRTVTGPDLLRRTVFYKVGHHGSHNATLREHGLEEMQKLDVAFVPVDRAMAVKKRWGKMPLGEIIERLDEITEGKVVQSDEPVPAPLKDRVRTDGLYYEISF